MARKKYCEKCRFIYNFGTCSRAQKEIDNLFTNETYIDGKLLSRASNLKGNCRYFRVMSKVKYISTSDINKRWWKFWDR